MSEVIVSSYSHYLIIGGAVVGLVWGGINANFVSISSLQILLARLPGLSIADQTCPLKSFFCCSG